MFPISARALRPAVLAALCLAAPALAAHRGIEVGGFVIEHDVVVAGPPELVYDSITGDVSPWWDHTFSEKPKSLYLEAKPGGGFYEIMNDAGDGARHAVVIYAERGKLLRFEGPLGLSGNALHMVFTYQFNPVGSDSTRLHFEGHAAGEMQSGWAEVVDQVWHHFLVERFKPYMDAKASR